MHVISPVHAATLVLSNSLQKGRNMRSITIDFDDNETLPDRIDALASELGITSQMLVKRAIVEHLGAYGLHSVPSDFKPTTLNELFVKSGVLKSE